MLIIAPKPKTLGYDILYAEKRVESFVYWYRINLICQIILLITALSRLAWCYGDLGVAIAIWQAGRVLNNVKICNEAIDIFRCCAFRRHVKNEWITDAGICHGSAGVAMIFRYMYKQTGIELFLDAYYYNHMTK